MQGTGPALRADVPATAPETLQTVLGQTAERLQNAQKLIVESGERLHGPSPAEPSVKPPVGRIVGALGQANELRNEAIQLQGALEVILGQP